MAEALEKAEEAARRSRSGSWGATAAVYVSVCRGDLEAARRWVEPRMEGLAGSSFAPVLAYLLARLGRTEEYEAMVDELEARAESGALGWSEVALARMGADARAEALDLLERERGEARPRSNYLARMWSSPLFEPLALEARFREIVDRLVAP
jgi:hypothetical protein